MSHGKIRKQNNCLNCDAAVEDHFCPKCGQANVEPKQSLWHLILHVFNDVTHFDGKFFSTMKVLLFRPGFLSDEYVRGRRVKYLDPIRMYLFISAIFALVYIATRQPDAGYVNTYDHPEYVRLVDSVRKTEDAWFSDGFTISTFNARGYVIQIMEVPRSWRLTEQEYNKLQDSLPSSEKAGWLRRYLAASGRGAWRAYDHDPYNFVPKFWENIAHSVSKLFFFSLPIFTLFLYLLYIRRRKEFYVVAHSIFALHFYCVLFLLVMLIYIPIDYFATSTDQWEWGVYGLMAGSFLYLTISMKQFYKQNWVKTVFKSIVLSVGTTIVIALILVAVFLNSFFVLGAH